MKKMREIKEWRVQMTLDIIETMKNSGDAEGYANAIAWESCMKSLGILERKKPAPHKMSFAEMLGEDHERTTDNDES